jgi:hypothetical protein
MVDYIDRDFIKLRMPDVSWSTTYDALLDQVVEEASREIDLYFGKDAGGFAVEAETARYFTGSGSCDLWVPEMAAAPSEVAVSEDGDLTSYTVWSATDYMLWPYNAADLAVPYVKLEIDRINGTKYLWYKYPKSVKITASWGYSTTPPSAIKKACMIQAIRSFKRAQQAYQDTGAITELGQMLYVKGLDPEVETILARSGIMEVTI